MSIRVMSLVMDSNLRSDEKFVALVMADYADEDGRGIYPSQATLARKVSKTARAVRMTIRKLEGAGVLAADPWPEGESHPPTKRYRLLIEALVGAEEVSGGAEAHFPRGRKPTSGEGGSPLPTIRQRSVREDLLSADQDEIVSHLHLLVVEAGLPGIRRPWGHDLARRGMTRRDATVAVSEASRLKKVSSAYIAGIIENRVVARSEGLDPDYRPPPKRQGPAARGEEHEAMPRAI